MSSLEYTASDYAPRHETIVFDPTELDADLLYDVSEELGRVGSTHRAERVEAERQKLLEYDKSVYRPVFTVEELSRIATMLAYAAAGCAYDGKHRRLQTIQEFGDVLESTAESSGPIFDEKTIQRDDLDSFKFRTDPSPANIIDVLQLDIEFVFDDDIDGSLIETER